MTRPAPEIIRERGGLTWFSSEDDGGPDVGLALGLGDGRSLYVGELANATLAEAGVDLSRYAVGWWVAVESAEGFEVIGPVADNEAAREMVDLLFSAIRGAPSSSAPSERASGQTPGGDKKDPS